eukprot:TRINITY_DN6371_c6_g1_i1.p1 TRINITY_DN6371_c6_g1~~TRINITY_DN6371_c6_g1_i1.p1  ORF type:complete len:240 (+),score=36.30 TRINITY_DN6371_c6_g1_i1:44-763(+)
MLTFTWVSHSGKTEQRQVCTNEGRATVADLREEIESKENIVLQLLDISEDLQKEVMAKDLGVEGSVLRGNIENGSIPNPIPQKKNPGGSYTRAMVDLTRVFDNVYVSGEWGASSQQAIKDHNITFIVNCCDRLKCRFASTLTEYYVARGFFDTQRTDLSAHLPPILRVLDRASAAGETVLVHCLTGSSRSTSAVISWMMSRKGMSFETAFSSVKKARPVTRPNKSFMEQLRAEGLTHVE